MSLCARRLDPRDRPWSYSAEYRPPNRFPVAGFLLPQLCTQPPPHPLDQFPVGAVHLLIRECAIFPAVTARQRHALLAWRYRSSLVHIEHFHALEQRRRALTDYRDHPGRRNVTIHDQSEVAPNSRVSRRSDDLLAWQETIGDEMYQVKFSKRARATQLGSCR